MVLLTLLGPTSCSQAWGKATNANKLTEIQIKLLASRILENTPEHIHFAEGTTFSWVVLSPTIKENPRALQDEVIRQLKEKYTVYSRKEEIPDRLVVKDNKGHPVGYRDGFSFSFKVEFEKEGTIKVYYTDWEGILAASSHWKRYEWTGNNWNAAEQSPLEVS